MVKRTRSKTPSAEDPDGAAAAPLSENGDPTAAAAVGRKGAQGSPLGKIKKRLSLGSSKNKTAAANAKPSKETSNGIAPRPKQSNHVTAGPRMHNDELSTVTEVTEQATVNGSMQPSNLSAVSTTGTNGDDIPKDAGTSAVAVKSTAVRGKIPVVGDAKEHAPKGTKPSALARLKKRMSFSKTAAAETVPAATQDESDKVAKAPVDDLAGVPEARGSRIVDPAAPEPVDRHDEAGGGVAPDDKNDATTEPEVDSPVILTSDDTPGALAELKHKLLAELKHKFSLTKSSPAKDTEDNVGVEVTTKAGNNVDEPDLQPVTESDKSHIHSTAAVEQTETELAVANAAPVDSSVHAVPVTVDEQEAAVFPSESVPAEDKESTIEKLRKKISFSKAQSEKVGEDVAAKEQDRDNLRPLAESEASKTIASSSVETTDDVAQQPAENATEPATTSEPAPVDEEHTISPQDKESAMQKLRKKLSFTTGASPANTTAGDEDQIGDAHTTRGIEVTIPPPLPDADLETIGTPDEIADQIKSAINAAPNLPGDGWDEDQTDPQPQDPTNLPHPHWKTNPQTGRPIPPDGSAPPNVSQQLLAVLQNEKMMREKGVFDVLHKMGGLKFLRTALAIGDGDGQDMQNDGGEDAGNEDDGNIYQRVDGLMLYAPLVPAEGDKVELADVLVVDPAAKKEKVRTVRAQDVNVKYRKGLAGLMGLWGLGWAVGSGAGKATTTEKDPKVDGPITESPGAPATSAPVKDVSVEAAAPARKSSIAKKVKTLSADATTTWVPSTTKISFQAMWWGFKLYLPPPVMDILSDDTVEAVKRAAMITSALTWFFTNIPVDMIPLPLQPAFVILQEVIPYISYIGTFITWSWSELKSFDEGYGVTLTATWLLPVALIPGTWKQEDFPTDPSPPSGTTPGDGTTPPTGTSPPSGTTPPVGTTPPSGTAPPAGTTPPTETAPPTTTPPASGDPSNEPSATPAPVPAPNDPAKVPSTSDPSSPPSTEPSQPTTSTPGGSATPAPTPADPLSSTPIASPVNKTIDGEGNAIEVKDVAPNDRKKRSSWKLW